jgi:hypothetical protein
VRKTLNASTAAHSHRDFVSYLAFAAPVIFLSAIAAASFVNSSVRAERLRGSAMMEGQAETIADNSVAVPGNSIAANGYTAPMNSGGIATLTTQTSSHFY